MAGTVVPERDETLDCAHVRCAILDLNLCGTPMISSPVDAMQY